MIAPGVGAKEEAGGPASDLYPLVRRPGASDWVAERYRTANGVSFSEVRGL